MLRGGESRFKVMEVFNAAGTGQVLDKVIERIWHELEAVEELETTDFKGQVLFHVERDTGDTFPLVAKFLHEKVTVVGAEIVEDNWDLLHLTELDVTVSVGRASGIAKVVVVVTDSWVVGRWLWRERFHTDGAILFVTAQH